MPTYDFTCVSCKYTFENVVVYTARDSSLVCPNCGADAVYNAISTLGGNRLAYHEDINDTVRRKFAADKNWRPPMSNMGATSSGRSAVHELEDEQYHRQLAAYEALVKRTPPEKHDSLPPPPTPSKHKVTVTGSGASPGSQAYYPGDPRYMKREV